MVIERRFNRPLFEINRVPIAWLSEYKTTAWSCNNCSAIQKKGSVVVEMFGKRTQRIETNEVDSHGNKKVDYKDVVVKKFVCVKCAAELYESNCDKIKLIGLRGVAAFRLMEEM